MDLEQTISKLRKERKKLDDIIKRLQDLVSQQTARAALPPPPKKRRGRKSMGNKEREDVSARMKAYWTKWREASGKRGQ